jgi:hypothetical protein
MFKTEKVQNLKSSKIKKANKNEKPAKKATSTRRKPKITSRPVEK